MRARSLLLASALMTPLTGCAAPQPTALGASLDLGQTLGGGAGPGFARADRPRAFAFPADHGAHSGFRTEWWYVTGNVATASERAFGYQLTFFRQALGPTAPASPSSWRNAHVWMAHFALTDAGESPGGGRGGFHAFERFAREAAGLAGATTEPFRVWLDDWELASTGAPFADAARPLRLRAANDDLALELELIPTRAPLLQGDGGLSAKGPEPGNASYYYSLPRLASRGALTLDGERHEVSGLSWLDREWSTSSLGAGVVGWDWMALHLGDGSDLTLYRLRRADGGVTPESAGSLAAADGSVRRFRASEIEMTPLGSWTSPLGGSYPAAWSLAIPSLALELEVAPLVANQELAVTVRYWEGAVRARGRRSGRPIAGDGYLEMTGYAPLAAGR